MPDISPAIEVNSADGLFRLFEYSELNQAQTLFVRKELSIQVVIETDIAEHQFRLVEYSELDEAMPLSWVKQTPTEPVVDITVGGSRPVGVWGPITGTEFTIEKQVKARFSREFALEFGSSQQFSFAPIQFEAEVVGTAQFTRLVEFNYPGTRMIALHYSQVLKDDRELTELIELGIL